MDNKRLKVVLDRTIADRYLARGEKIEEIEGDNVQCPSSFPPAVERNNELVVRIGRLNMGNITTTAAAVVPSLRQPAVPPPPPRRRHALIPRRVTYRKGVGTSPGDIENVCASPFSCGGLLQVCQHCDAKFFEKEPNNRARIHLSCCKNGQVSIPPIRCPPELRSLYTESTSRTRNFLEHIRAANSLFAMASFKTSAPARRVAGQGRWSFSVCGQIYHFTVGVPTSQNLRRPILSHYYFLEVVDILDRRTQFLRNRVSTETVEFLERSLRTHNKYVKAFHTIGEVLREETNRGGERSVENIVIAFCRNGNINEHNRRCRLPESRSAIAGIYRTDPPFHVDLKLYSRVVTGDGGRIVKGWRHELKNLNAMCDPMVYPLLFPFGEDGYCQYIHHNNHHVTMREFYRFRIQCRSYFSILHNGGKLFQQYLVDAWVRVEADMLWWFRQHQEKFRYTAQTAIRRAIAINPTNADRACRVVILPSAFQGGPRNIRRQYFDALAVAARHGKPDLFITFTCNPSWPEIRDNLEYLQKPEHRPDLVCRVFRIKFLQFLDDVVHKQIYGVVKNYQYVIEFQKRGLPHAHMVVTFILDDRLVTAEQVDAIVSATIPDVASQPRLYDLVARYQVHRPCGTMYPSAGCMVDGRCSKFFPKDYSNKTVLGAGIDHRPIYRRPKDNRVIRLPTHLITNTRIVPYNPYALGKYQTHINFEVVGSLLTLKYLFKYLTKGADYITIFEEGEDAVGGRFEIDEIKRYLDCRCVSSMEAAWHLLEFKMHDRSHAVIVLPVHLPGDPFTDYEEGQDLGNEEVSLARRSKLEAWFQLNRDDVGARKYHYVEIPEYYVWVGKEGRWCSRRQVSKTIGIVAHVSRQQGNLELFYLRLLLRHVRGAASFEALRAVDGVVHNSFGGACAARNLLIHMDEYDLCLSEAALMKHPHQMRRLFGQIGCILYDESVEQVLVLWRKYKYTLMDDFLKGGRSRRDSEISTIREINGTIHRNRPQLTCATLGITIDDGGEVIHSEELNLNGEDENVPRLQYGLQLLNQEQKGLFLSIVQAISRTTGRIISGDLCENMRNEDDEHIFFVDGPAGTGKTFLFNTLINYVSAVLKIRVLSVAWTEIAASLLVGGKTVHRGFNLPLSLMGNTTVGWHLDQRESEVIREVGLILWDEAQMSHRYAVEAVDRYLRKLTGSRDVAMGGKCVVFGGDFRQSLPVIPFGQKEALIDISLKRTSFWSDIRRLKLTTNVRVARQAVRGGDLDVRHSEKRQLGDKSFEEWLLALGEGRLPYVMFEGLKSAPDDLIEIPNIFHVSDLVELLSFVYPDGVSVEDVADRAIFCPTNDVVKTINDCILDSLDGECKTFFSVDESKRQEENELYVPLDILNAVNVAELPPHELKLKVGAVVMLMRNLDLDNGECNGTRMRVSRLGKHLIECRLVSGENRGRTIWLPKIRMIAQGGLIPQDIIRTQFPVRLAYAMTINKCQGQTFRRAGIYLKRSCFMHGQLYVAFSRVGSSENVRVYVEDGLKQGSFKTRMGQKFTSNVVFHAFLRDGAIEDGDLVVPPQIISRGNIGEPAEAQEKFGGDIYHDVFGNAELTLADAARVVSNKKRRHPDPNVDNLPAEFVPYRTIEELTARMSIDNRPGTSGVGLAGPSSLLQLHRSASPASEESD